MKTKIFEIFHFLKISEFSLIDDEVRVFRKNETFIQSGLGNKNPRFEIIAYIGYKRPSENKALS
jgi:hypothetical protein